MLRQKIFALGKEFGTFFPEYPALSNPLRFLTKNSGMQNCISWDTGILPQASLLRPASCALLLISNFYSIISLIYKTNSIRTLSKCFKKSNFIWFFKMPAWMMCLITDAYFIWHQCPCNSFLLPEIDYIPGLFNIWISSCCNTFFFLLNLCLVEDRD